METTLGLLGVVAFILAILALAAAVTWVVVKVDGVIRARRRASA